MGEGEGGEEDDDDDGNDGDEQITRGDVAVPSSLWELPILGLCEENEYCITVL